MDPVSHALFGAAVSRVALARPLGGAAWFPGAAAALLPDADALIRSAADPLLYAEFHRHFTHSLAFIPVGGTLAAVPWLLAHRSRGKRKWYWAASVAGYATHGALDASTTYGTTLLWPFSESRIAWNWISIVDPLFTMILACGVAAAAWRRSIVPAVAALTLCAAYVGAGAVQGAHATDVQHRIAAARGHRPLRAEVFPGFLTNVVWRSLYEADGTLYMDRIRVPWRGSPGWRPVTAVASAPEESLPAVIRGTPRLARDFRRFEWFTSGWIARDPGDVTLLGDARYSLSEHRFVPVWGIRFHPSSSPPVEWVNRSSQRRIDIRELWSELLAEGEEGARFRPVP